MSTEAFIVELDPETQTTLKVLLFRDIQNVEEIRSKVLKGEWKCALVKPSLVVDPFQLAVAANKAAVAHSTRSMLTRNVFTELLFNLSLTKNITNSLRKFGTDKEKQSLVCFLVTPDNDASEDIIPQIKGELCPISELQNMTSMTCVNSAYNINTCEMDLVDVIVSKMVTKQFVSHDVSNK